MKRTLECNIALTIHKGRTINSRLLTEEPNMIPIKNVSFSEINDNVIYNVTIQLHLYMNIINRQSSN